MRHRKTILVKSTSLVLSFLFLVASPSQAILADVIGASKSDPQDVASFRPDIAAAPQLPITDPDKIIVAENMGRIKEIFKGQDNRLIINIQDAHCNLEAQTNISNILDVLAKQYGLTFVALEGSAGELDPSLFTTFPDDDIRKEVAAYFLKQGKINGAEYFAITSKNPARLYGVETKEYYLKNLTAFTNTVKDRDKLKACCTTIKGSLERLKGRLFSKGLKELDAKSSDYKDGKIDFLSYCAYLRGQAGASGVSLAPCVNLGVLYKTLDIEKTIDFNAVDQERSKVISLLEKGLSEKELEELFSKSVSFKAGQTSAPVYYAYLKGVAAAKKVQISAYPNLNLYIDYVTLYDTIDNAALLKEIVRTEGSVKERLFTDNDQRRLDTLSRNIKILENMLDISVSKEDAEYFKNNRGEFRSAAFINFIDEKNKERREGLDAGTDLSVIDAHLSDLEEFYRIADERDDAIIENTLKKMDEEKLRVAVLVTGGYHTAGIAERLKQRGISYVVITPRTTKPDRDNPYLSILCSEVPPAAANSGSSEKK